MMMHQLNEVLLGAIAMASFVAGMFFLRFWSRSRDRFFALFAASFFVEAVNRGALALSAQVHERSPRSQAGLIRLASVLQLARDTTRGGGEFLALGHFQLWKKPAAHLELEEVFRIFLTRTRRQGKWGLRPRPGPGVSRSARGPRCPGSRACA